jgi:hypothetical protein
MLKVRGDKGKPVVTDPWFLVAFMSKAFVGGNEAPSPLAIVAARPPAGLAAIASKGEEGLMYRHGGGTHPPAPPGKDLIVVFAPGTSRP